MTFDEGRQNSHTDLEGFPNGESPRVVVDNVSRNKTAHAPIILFANEKGGVGKTTLVFNTAIDLCNRGYRVLAIDLDFRQRSLARAIENRMASNRCLGLDLPVPKVCVLQQPSGPMLVQELNRLGSDRDVILIDAPGHDSPVARRAMALAQTIVTPINPSFFDLDVLGHFDPVSLKFRKPGPFAQAILDIRAEQMRRNLLPARWIIAKNRIRGAERSHNKRIEPMLAQLSDQLGLTIAEGLTERVAYRSLLQYGFTISDIKRVPQLAHMQIRNVKEISRLTNELNIAPIKATNIAQSVKRPSAKVPEITRTEYGKSVRAITTGSKSNLFA